MREFLLDRIRLVPELLGDSAPEVAYADLVLILTAVISASAALRWTKQHEDRKRFVELLVRESSEEYHLSWISIPALINRGHVSETDTAYGKPGQSTRIFRDHEIDCSYEDVRSTYANLQPNALKKCSYAVLIYEQLRCGYAHEYWHREWITHIPPSRRAARISYIDRGTPDGFKRMISFHLDYLVQVAEYHAANVPDSPQQPPAKWWLELDD